MKNLISYHNKCIIYRILISLILLLTFNAISKATSYTWVGTTDTAWTTNSNWNPSTGHPHLNDTASIGSGTPTRWPHLTANDTITRLVITNGTLNLEGFILNVTGTASCSGGTMSNGTFKPSGSTITYSGTTFTCKVNAVVGRQSLNGSTFSDSTYFEETNSTTTNGNGGNTFSGYAKFVKNSSSGSATWSINNSSGNTFSSTAVFVNNSSGNLVVAGVGSTSFNGNIQVGSTSSGDVNIGSTSGGTSTLASGKTITIEAGGFSNGTLLIRDFTQSGSTAQSFTITSSAILNLISATFNGAVTFSTPSILLKNSTFNGNATLTNSGSVTSSSYGGNVFNGTTSINNSGTAILRFTNTANDEYYGSVTFTGNSTNPFSPSYANTAIYRGNLTYSGGQVSFTTGKNKFTGSAATQAYSGAAARDFNDIIINKSAGYVTIDTTVNITDSLKLMKGNIVTTSTHLLVFKAGSIVYGASDSGFVSGPVKKFGNTAFVFPTGKDYDFRPLTITAPSSATDAFTAQYIDTVRPHGNTFDTGIDYVHPINYWTLVRNSGSSNVYVTLSWSKYNTIHSSTDVRVVNWDGSKWKNVGNASTTGNERLGTVTANSNFTQSTSIFALAGLNFATSTCNHQSILPDAYYTFDEAGGPQDALYGSDLDAGTNTININSGSGIYNYLSYETPQSYAIHGHTLADLSGKVYAVEFLFRANNNYSRQSVIELFRLSDNGTGTYHARAYLGVDLPQIHFETEVDQGAGPVTRDMQIDLNGIGNRSLAHLTNGDFHHFVFKYNLTSGIKEVWIDGQLNAGFYNQDANLIGNYAANTILKLQLLPNFTNDYQQFVGDIDEICFYGSDVCPEQIIDHYNDFKIGNHYTITSGTSLTTLIPQSKELFGEQDVNEYPIGYTPLNNIPNNYIPDYSRIKSDPLEQLLKYPLPRYFPSSTLNKNFNSLSPGLFYNDGTVDPSNGQLDESVFFQEELAGNWNYYYNLAQNTHELYDYGTGNHAKFFPARWICEAINHPANKYKYAVSTFWQQLNPLEIGEGALSHAYIIDENLVSTLGGSDDDYYLVNSVNMIDPPFINPSINGCYLQNNKFWSPKSDENNYAVDGQTQNDYLNEVDNIIGNTGTSCSSSALNKTIDYVAENNEVAGYAKCESFINTWDTDLATEISGYPVYNTWQPYWSHKNLLVNGVYQNGFFSNAHLSPGFIFTNYSVDGHGDNYNTGYIYSFLRQTQSDIGGGVRYPTPSLYTISGPGDWYRDNGAYHFWQWLMQSRPVEIAAGDNLMAPYVSPGYSIPDEATTRPSQYLGLLKCVSMTGVDFFNSFYLDDHVINDPKGYVWQLSTISYAQAISSRYEDILRHGILMTGNVPIDKGGATNSYTFSSRYPGNIAVARKYDDPGSNILQYGIAGAIMPYSNAKGSVPDQDDFMIEDFDGTQNFDLQFKIRRQGSVYIFDNYDAAHPIFYQVDGWQEAGHPDRWSRDFHFEAELYDNTSDEPVRKTKDGTNGFITNGDFRAYTTYITFDQNTDVAEYDFTPRQSGTGTDYYLWVRARNDGNDGDLDIGLFDGSSTTNNTICIKENDWTWYRFETGTLNPIVYVGLQDQKYTLTFSNADQHVEIDQFIISPDKNLTLSPEPDRCTSLSTNYCLGGVVQDVTLGSSDKASTINLTGKKVILIHSDFEVDQDISFTGLTIIVDAGKKITVDAGYKLTIDGYSKVMGCNDMWAGIVLEDGTSELEITNAVIEDATKAIDVQGDPSGITNIALINSAFDHNYISLNCESANTTDYTSLVIKSCNFRCQDRDLFNVGGKSHAQILLNNADELTIGDGTATVPDLTTQNTFEDSQFGILLNSPVHFLVNNNYFNNNNPDGGSANWRPAHPNIASGGLILFSETHANYTKEVTNCTFENNYFAFGSTHETAQLHDNTFNNNFRSVTFQYCESFNDATDHIKVFDNNITHTRVGVDLYTNSSSTEFIHNNTIDVIAPSSEEEVSAGVRILSLGGNTAEISNNTITTYGTYGIYANGEYAVAPLSIISNTVNMLQTNSLSQKLFGIKLDDCFAADVENNLVAGLSEESMPGKTSIQVENCNNSTARCNSTDLTENGIAFIQDCNFSTVMGNHFYKHWSGLIGGNISAYNNIIGDQIGDPNNSPSNEYNGPFDSGNEVYRWNTLNTFQADDIKHENSASFKITSSGSNNLFDPFTPVTTSPNLLSCPPAGAFVFNPSLSAMISLAQAEVPEEDALRNTIVSAKHHLYLFLDDSTNWLDSSMVLSDFYDSIATANLGLVTDAQRINEALSDPAVRYNPGVLTSAISAARTANDLLTDDETYSVNEKLFNDVYYNWLEDGADALDSDDSTNLISIANQCPYTGGPAVYRARVLFEVAEGGKYYDDETLCENSLPDAKQMYIPVKPHAAKDAIVHATVYPNPTKGSLTVLLTQKVENGTIELYDLSGRLIFSNALNDKGQFSQFSIELLTPGSYFYKINADNADIARGKIVLIK